MTIKVLIADDEYSARMELRYLLEKYDDIRVIGEATNGAEALALTRALDYDVVFLDVEMPGLAGVAVAQKLLALKKTPCIVFVTAYDDYAVQAFDVKAVDYLLKPVSEARMKETISRIKEKLQFQNSELQRLAAEKNERTLVVAARDVVYAFAEKGSVFIRTYNDELETRFTLEQLNARLPRRLFFRSHRSYLVNVDYIREIKPYVNGAYILCMNDRDGSEVPVSRGRVKELKERLGLASRIRKSRKEIW
jgi:DNA-binding LytR/AlgR family response regulator